MSVILAHFVGDYLLQTDHMAARKKSSWWWCAVHVFFYMLPFYMCRLSWWQLALIALQHFLQDGTNVIYWFFSRSGKKAFLAPPFAPWSLILLDNLVHILWIQFVLWVTGFS